MTHKPAKPLRSQTWFGPDTLRGFGHRSRLAQLGLAQEDYVGKPVIAILNPWSELSPCHTHFPERAEEIKRGVWQAGGFPVVLPVQSLPEPFQKPSTMLYRNLLAIEVEELLRSMPVDGVVLMGGCDKTVPALLMGAFSMNLPAIVMPAGPMLRGRWRGESLGSGTDAWRNWDLRRAGQIGECEWREMEEGIARSAGHCMTMGTAATMCSAAEALGMCLPGAASILAADAAHSRMAAACGRRVVELVAQDITPRSLLDARHFDNAIVTVLALGGSTNAVIHLLAMARRAGVPLDLARFDELARKVPVLADIKPTGRFLMEDFFYAGGLPALLDRVRDLLHLDAPTVAGISLGASLEGARCFNDEVIRVRDNPLYTDTGIAVLRGSLAPNGAVIKPGAAEPRLRQHRGPAVVFEDRADLTARIDDPDLPVTADSVMVLRNTGPIGAPGMPEWGQLPIPKKLLEQGVRDMVRISDARMSGTSYGACVLHVSPESAVGGPLALVCDGDMIEIDVAQRRLELLVPEEELARRRAAWKPRPAAYARGYGRMFLDHVMQAHEGCDFDFLDGTAPIKEPDIF